MRIKSLALSLVLALACAGAAQAADDSIGQVKTKKGDVLVLRQGQAKPLNVGDHVLQSDTVKTEKGASVGITFLDNSMMSLGPASELALDEFKFNSTTREGVFNTRLARGTLAVKSGQIVQQKPETMHIRTPAALLGVRGTEFVVNAGG